jgi:hypothetical protein
MDNIQLTRSELALLRLWIARQQSESNGQLGVDLAVLYGKINMMYNDACNRERQARTA